jgi:uncharacterized Zn finger protein
MKCPNCNARRAVELDIHSEGYTPQESPVKECGSCGLVWRVREDSSIDIIKQSSI